MRHPSTWGIVACASSTKRTLRHIPERCALSPASVSSMPAIILPLRGSSDPCASFDVNTFVRCTTRCASRLVLLLQLFLPPPPAPSGMPTSPRRAAPAASVKIEHAPNVFLPRADLARQRINLPQRIDLVRHTFRSGSPCLHTIGIISIMSPRTRTCALSRSSLRSYWISTNPVAALPAKVCCALFQRSPCIVIRFRRGRGPICESEAQSPRLRSLKQRTQSSTHPQFVGAARR